ncbi:hypothetical protein A1Q1_06842 [Trichosporon asahii var. asahii CBS 2479]|uniref:VWFA domain-containing protein n=1 Tax=Trichosporon asahii var. asahii (strain ATCC 90039 / CBS 2479 / JCM 2466 / KCTC 7840 / NBRC 103889/ NCYC 2677 / UAMH 7654) TaxID=1186058 RepID=J6F4I4_TRIAS|nr:hypothetical protein A1Q1_06842 [Trichosporon asahii var. asahii CBS 2479]EJT51919.1 hypothetical protein A1Q1_06842 [Trichosporon asahii var. asahii CBS 2479]
MKFAIALSLLAALASAATQKCNPAARHVGLVIDQSTSNQWTDDRNFRLEGAKQIVQSLTSKTEASPNNLEADSVAVVGFAWDAWQVLDFSDPTAASGAIESLRDNLKGGTNVGDGMRLAMQNLQNLSADQLSGHSAIVLFTDGEDTQGNKDAMQSALREAKAKGVRVSFVRLDSESGNPWLGLFKIGGDKNYIDAAMTESIISTGGTVSIVRNASNLQAFVDQVLKNGLTGDDGKCGGTTIENPGGVLKNDVTSIGLCSTNAQAVYTYKAEKNEKLTFGVGLTSKNNPVQLTVVYENKSTGERKEIKVNGSNASGTVEAFAQAGQDVTLTVNPSGASRDACQYQVGLKVTPGQGPQPTVVPTTSATPSTSTAPTTSATPTTSASQCPSVTASTTTVERTVVTTMTVPAPPPSASVCICKCGTEGSKPLPKFEL